MSYEGNTVYIDPSKALFVWIPAVLRFVLVRQTIGNDAWTVDSDAVCCLWCDIIVDHWFRVAGVMWVELW